MVGFVNRVVNDVFFNSREIFDKVQKASDEDRCSMTDLPVLLTAVGTGVFCLIWMQRRTVTILISAY